jgi:hypothetical protein
MGRWGAPAPGTRPRGQDASSRRGATPSSSFSSGGRPPNEARIKFDENGKITDVGLSANEQSAAHQTTQAQYAVAAQCVERGATYIDPKFFNGDGSLKSPNQISADEWSVYDAQLTVAMSERVQINSMLEKFRDTLDRVNGIDN